MNEGTVGAGTIGAGANCAGWSDCAWMYEGTWPGGSGAQGTVAAAVVRFAGNVGITGAGRPGLGYCPVEGGSA